MNNQFSNSSHNISITQNISYVAVKLHPFPLNNKDTEVVCVLLIEDRKGETNDSPRREKQKGLLGGWGWGWCEGFPQ